MLSATIDDRKLMTTLDAMPAKIQASLYKTIFSLALRLQRHIVQDKLQGQVLAHRTGNLQRSIQNAVTQTDQSVIGKVFSSGDVKYAAIHEYGGTIPAHIILPKNGEALHFILNGKEVFLKSVNHPGAIMPQRSFMRSSLNDMRQEITTEIGKAVVGAMQV